MDKRPNLAIPPSIRPLSEVRKLRGTGSGPTDLAIPPGQSQRLMFIERFTREHPDFVRRLKEWSKDELINALTIEIVGHVYDRAGNVTVDDIREDGRASVKASTPLPDPLQKGTLDEKFLELAKWEKEKMVIAGNDIKKVAEIARIEGMIRVLIRAYPTIKAFKERGRILAKGRAKGVIARQEAAKDKQAKLIKAIADMFDKDEKPGWNWTNPEIAKFLKDKNLGYEYKSILQTVKREAARYRKARKERQASKYPSR